jgi:hypothetical protein
MNCSNCGKPLPEGVAYCPNCGTSTANPYSSGDGNPYDPTARASAETPPPPPFTSYGESPYSSTPANPYETPSTNPYNPYNPYSASAESQAGPTIPATPSAPPPPTLRSEPSLPTQRSAPPPQRRNRTGLIVGVVILVLILVGGGVFLVLQKNTGGTSNTPPQNTGTTTTSPAQLTATAQAQASVVAQQATATAQAALTATAAANATATASVIAANPNPYPPGGGTLALLDPLSNNNQGYGWDTGNSGNGACTFTGGAYQISTPKTQYFYFCATHLRTYSNFAYEVQMKVLKGDCGGLIIRADTNSGKLYLFEICQDGSYNFYVNRDFNGNMTNLSNGPSSAIKAGLNQSNTIGISAQSSTLTLYVNKQKIASVTDGSYSQGSIGLVVDAYNNPSTVAFNNARLWTL